MVAAAARYEDAVDMRKRSTPNGRLVPTNKIKISHAPAGPKQGMSNTFHRITLTTIQVSKMGLSPLNYSFQALPAQNHIRSI